MLLIDSMDKHLYRSDKLLWQKINDKVILISPGRTRIYEMNSIDSHIWELSDGSRAIQQVIDDTVTFFQGVDYSKVLECVAQLVGCGIIISRS
jgi:hypothetical protein